MKSKKSDFMWPRIKLSDAYAVLKQLYLTISIYDRSGIFKKFEDLFAEHHNRKYALVCNSGTTAIHSMFVAAGLSPGDEVLCPAYTFFATVTPLLFTGAVPVLCDCDQNGNIDPEELSRKLTEKTKAVIVTHMWGIPCQMDLISKFCKDHSLLLLEDCSHAHGATYKGKPVGSFGAMSAWSLQGQKIITGGEGGVFTTDNPDFYYKALLLGHYNKRCKQEIDPKYPLYKYSTTGMGLKYRAHPLAITIAYQGLKKLDKIKKYKRLYASQIIQSVQHPALKAPVVESDVQPAWYALIFQYDRNRLKDLSIEILQNRLREEGLIETDIPNSTAPLNLLPLFNKPEDLFPIYNKYRFSYKPGDFPMAEKFYNSALKFPVWTEARDQKTVNKYIRGINKVLSSLENIQ